MNRSMPGLPVHHQLPEFTQTHVHRVGDAIQPSHPLNKGVLVLKHESEFLYIELKNELHEHGMYSSLYSYQY